MPREDVAVRKNAYFERLGGLLQQYEKIFLVNVDNVGSTQMHQIRQELRGQAIVVMGKNTMARTIVRGLLNEKPELAALLPYLKGNVGLVFTNGDLKKVKATMLQNRIKAPARAGAIAPCDVKVPACNTGMEPGKTSFFQALGIPTKISRGTIEIISDVDLIKTGDKVGASEAALLNMMVISPFTYGMSAVAVYEKGSVFSPKILDVTDEKLIENMQSVIKSIAAISLSIGLPTAASVPHSLVNGYKKILAVAVATDITFPLAEKVKDMLANPTAYAAAAPVAAAAPAAGKAAAKVEEPAEESDDDMGFGLFD